MGFLGIRRLPVESISGRRQHILLGDIAGLANPSRPAWLISFIRASRFYSVLEWSENW